MSTKTHRDEVIRRLKRIETRLHLLCTRFEVNTEDQELGGQLVLDFGDDEYERIVRIETRLCKLMDEMGVPLYD